MEEEEERQEPRVGRRRALLGGEGRRMPLQPAHPVEAGGAVEPHVERADELLDLAAQRRGERIGGRAHSANSRSSRSGASPARRSTTASAPARLAAG